MICYFNYYDGIKLQSSKMALQSLKCTQALSARYTSSANPQDELLIIALYSIYLYNNSNVNVQIEHDT